MRKLLAILLLSAPAGAQDFGASVDAVLSQVHRSAASVTQAVSRGDAQARMGNQLEQALTAMEDGPEIGGQVASFVRDRKIAVRFEDQKQPSRTDGKAVVLDVKMSAYPRAIGPRVAWEVAPMMLADMPECAEKEYMRRSITARVWLELGGDPKGLPVMEWSTGDEDEELSREMKLWLDDKPEGALEKVGKATKTVSLIDLLEVERDPAKHEALKGANQRFTAFVLAEERWRQSYGR